MPRSAWCSAGFPGNATSISSGRSATSAPACVVYRRFKVPEVWFWRRDGLEILALDREGAAYERVARSRLLPELEVGLLERCVRITSWREARRAFRPEWAAGN